MAQAPNTFLFAIRSVVEMVAGAPNVIRGQNLNVSIAEGDPIARNVLYAAEDLVYCIREQPNNKISYP